MDQNGKAVIRNHMCLHFSFKILCLYHFVQPISPPLPELLFKFDFVRARAVYNHGQEVEGLGLGAEEGWSYKFKLRLLEKLTDDLGDG